MILYQKAGEIPKRKHVASYLDEKLVCEELFSTFGFSGNYSTFYHLNPPTQVADIKKLDHVFLQDWVDAPYDYHHFESMKWQQMDELPVILFYNDQLRVGIANYAKGMHPIFKNVDGEELYFVHKGEGRLFSPCGELSFKSGDYLIVPKGLPYQLEFLAGDNRLFYVESKGSIRIPASFLNNYGQLLEDAPYCERDIRLPIFRKPQKGAVKMQQKKGDQLYEIDLQNHPFDLLGWDGYVYPFAFNIEDYMPKMGKIHLPPPVHKVFESDGSVICNFVPRLLDFHDGAVTAPYYHSNIDSDEILYYLDGEFLSRKGISAGSITLHPMGLAHGPQPGRQEASIGKKETKEFAVMVDTFKPMSLTKICENLRQADYRKSWWS